MHPTFPILDFAIALFIGALVGIEREQRKSAGENSAAGGIRTFILYAQAGAVSAWLSLQMASMWIFAAGAICITATILAGYYVQARQKPDAFGLTTEVAAIVVFFLGGATLFGFKALAVALAIATSTLLAYKQPLHGLVSKIGQDDLYAGLKLLVATFIVLPVLPNRTVDPWDALNPYKIWWLVILISGLSLVGYAASRWLGAEKGIPLTGFFGGLVSSTAVSLSFARRSREDANGVTANALAAGLLLSWVVMFGRVIVEVIIVNPVLLRPLLIPMLTMGLMSLMAAGYFFRQSAAGRATPEAGQVPLKNPFSLTAAIQFALFFTAVLVVVKLVQNQTSGQGLYFVAALAGLTDVDAITLSMAGYARQTGSEEIAVTAITIAAITNTLTKCGIVAFLGTSMLTRRVALATAVILAAAAISLAFV